MMNDRDRLIELIEQAEGLKNNDFPSVEEIADHILADGWIRMPCKVGDDIWWIDTEANEINCAENDIKAICYYGEGNFKVIVCDEETPEDIGTEWCMLTKEEAEAKLKELKENAR